MNIVSDRQWFQGIFTLHVNLNVKSKFKNGCVIFSTQNVEIRQRSFFTLFVRIRFWIWVNVRVRIKVRIRVCISVRISVRIRVSIRVSVTISVRISVRIRVGLALLKLITFNFIN